MTQQQDQFDKALERARANEAQKAETRAARKAIIDARYEAFKRDRETAPIQRNSQPFSIFKR